jgi:hypothetical protein
MSVSVNSKVSGANFIGTTTNSSGNTVVDSTSVTALAATNIFKTAGNIREWDLIGDSRVYDHNSTSAGGMYGKTCKSWIAWANAFYKQSFRVVNNYGVGGNRTDQYLKNGNFELSMANTSGILVFGPPVFNDINQALAGYTDADGNVVSLSNVVTLTIARLVTYITSAVQNGKTVICMSESGGTSFTAAQVACVHEFNRRYRDAIKAIPNVYFYNQNRLIWNPTSSTTAIAFKTNYSGDGTHYQQMAGRVIGKDWATYLLPNLFPAVDTAVDNVSSLYSNGVGQLVTNPLLTTLTGGTNAGNITLTSGNIPAGVTISAASAGALSVAITSAANADGFGNDVTFAFTATAAVVGRIDFGSFNSTYVALTDYLEMGLEYDVAVGNTGLFYPELQLVGNVNSVSCFDMLGANQSPAMGPPSGIADTGIVLRTNKSTFPAGNASVSYALARLNVFFTAAGSGTITIRRPFLNRYR